MTSPITGIDHVVILVRELDEAAARYRRLGFSLTPRGTHSPHMGTGNYCIMFQTDYVELLGVLNPTPHNAAWRDRVAAGEGLKSAALASDDAVACQAHFANLKLSPSEPLEFGRPVDMPGGPRDAKFRIVRLPDEAVPGLGLFVCQHFTRDLVWIPEYQGHLNGVTGLASIIIASTNPATTAAPYARVFGSDPKMDQWGDIHVGAGKGRSFRFISPDRAKVAYRGAVVPQADVYVAAVEMWTETTGRAAAAIAKGGLPHDRPEDGRVRVRAENACGVVIDFIEAPR